MFLCFVYKLNGNNNNNSIVLPEQLLIYQLLFTRVGFCCRLRDLLELTARMLPEPVWEVNVGDRFWTETVQDTVRCWKRGKLPSMNDLLANDWTRPLQQMVVMQQMMTSCIQSWRLMKSNVQQPTKIYKLMTSSYTKLCNPQLWLDTSFCTLIYKLANNSHVC